MSLGTRLRLRLRRDGLRARARLQGLRLSRLADRTGAIRPGARLLFATIRNEAIRLPFFLDYYRRLGIGHFLFVDNGSSDAGPALLADQPDCSVWRATGSYRRARFGMDWINALLARHGRGHWVLVVDPDEFLVYPYMDSRGLGALTGWLDSAGLRSFPAMLIDLYAQTPLNDTDYRPGENPMDTLTHFDPGNYVFQEDPFLGNLWIQGGPRMRAFFADRPGEAPALNKIPLVRWAPGMVYASSTHSLMPRGLNRVFDAWGGEKISGALLHAKFLKILADKSAEERRRREHYAGGREYDAYASGYVEGLALMTPQSVRYRGWRQLEALGLISTGGWL